MTNKEIAKRLGISESTLSFIINNRPGIADKTRSRVIREINEMGFGHLLKKDASAFSKNICFVVYKRHGRILNQSPFFMLLMEQIDEKARMLGYNLRVRMLDGSGSAAEEIRSMNASDTSGMIIFATEMLDEDMEQFKQAAMPIVSLDNDFTHLDIDSVVINNRVGTLKAVKHLVDLEHAKIGYLQCKTPINSFVERAAGYRSALDHFGLELSARHRFAGGFTEEESYQDFRKILTDGAELPTAFVSDTDTLAAGVMRALMEHGVKIPDDVSVVGFDDRPLCEVMVPNLTSISVPRSFGARAVELLEAKITAADKDAVDYRKFSEGVGLVVRRSTCSPSIHAKAKKRLASF